MTNSNENEKKETTQVHHEADRTQDNPVQELNHRPCNKNNTLLAKAALILAITAIAFNLYNTQTNKKLQSHLADENKTLMAQVEDLGQNQSNIQDQLTEKENKIREQQRELQSRIDSLNKELQVAMQQRLYQNQDWLLLKARYYLELAQINTHWSDNFNASVSLLQQADKLLSQLNAPQIFEIRQIIAKEIAQLKAMPPIDIPGLLSQLDAAQLSVSNLTIQSPLEKNNATGQTELPQSSNASTWKSRLKDNLKLLEQLVIVRRTDEQIKPLMSPLFESALKESIRLNLQEAQWAILNNNTEVYQLALKQASSNIKRIFDEQAPETLALLKQISELQNIKLIQEKPVTGSALPQLNQIIEQIEQQDNNVNKNEKGAN